MNKEILKMEVKNAARAAVKNAAGDRIDWTRAMVDAYKEKLRNGMALYGEKQKAIEHASAHSTAGPKAREQAVKEFFK